MRKEGETHFNSSGCLLSSGGHQRECKGPEKYGIHPVISWGCTIQSLSLTISRHPATGIFDKPLRLKQGKSRRQADFTPPEMRIPKHRQKGAELLQLAKWEHKPVIVLAGRPYHIDPK